MPGSPCRWMPPPRRRVWRPASSYTSLASTTRRARRGPRTTSSSRWCLSSASTCRTRYIYTCIGDQHCTGTTATVTATINSKNHVALRTASQHAHTETATPHTFVQVFIYIIHKHCIPKQTHTSAVAFRLVLNFNCKTNANTPCRPQPRLSSPRIRLHIIAAHI